MDVNVKVTVDLGDKTMSLFNGFMPANQGVANADDTAGKVPEKYAEPAKEETSTRKSYTLSPESDTADKPAPRTRNRTKAAEEAPAKEEPAPGAETAAEEAPAEFKGMDDDAKLEAIRGEVSKNVKKGRSIDVKFMLAQFDADKAGSLDPIDYEAFYNAIVRYGNGDALKDIFPSNLN